MPPAVAGGYLQSVVKDFEKFAKEHYTAALKSPDTAPDLLLAGIRYVETRRVEGHERRLREVLTAAHKNAIARDLLEATVDALLATSEDTISTAQFLAITACSDSRAAVAAACESGVRRLRAAGTEAILQELTKPHPPILLRKLARLLADISKVKSPEPVTFWQKADEAARGQATAVWRSRIVEKRGLP